ncbi:glycine--tRNA ligase subunit beta [Oceanobacillus sp. CAU 1775]
MAKNVLIEVGLEELPARFIDQAEQSLKEKTMDWLNESRITFESIESFSTPRRLAIVISDLAEMQATLEEEVRGPALSIAKDENGNWSKAAIGFAKGQGKTVEDLLEKEVNGKTYVFVNKTIEGQATKELLPHFKDIIESIPFASSMRWGEEAFRYARPIRWLTAIYGEEIIPFEIANVKTSNISYGHRYLGSEMKINKATEYETLLKDNFVIANAKEREALILSGIRNLEEEHDLQIIVEQDLLDEVRNLVEYPTVFMGSFEDHFLQLPSEVLIISMKEHQRYFPVRSKDNKLLPHFIGVRNGDSHALDNVVRGNEKVLRARLADAEFFFEEDQKQPLENHLAKLNRVVFQEKLGTLAEKVERVRLIGGQISEKLTLGDETGQLISRAAVISKFDLMTNMVDEFPELQGVIGEIYAKNYEENDEVSTAIREQYLPKQANSELPQTVTGTVLSIADKVDTIVGILSVGLIPSGSQDPYALRRQATGVIRMLQNKEWDISLEDILQIATEVYSEKNIDLNSDTMDKIHDFFKQRVAYILKEQDVENDIFKAVTVNEIGNVRYLIEKAKLLSAKRKDSDFKEKEEALVRVLNLSSKAEESTIQEDLFETDSEKALYEQLLGSKTAFVNYDNNLQAEPAFNQLENLAVPIHAFFENNMVMADNEAIKNNRLALIFEISKLIKAFADLSLIEWKQSFN